MSMNAARHARSVVRNAEQVLAMELICAAQAIWLQTRKPGCRGQAPGAGVAAACAAIRDAGIAAADQGSRPVSRHQARRTVATRRYACCRGARRLARLSARGPTMRSAFGYAMSSGDQRLDRTRHIAVLDQKRVRAPDREGEQADPRRRQGTGHRLRPRPPS